MMDETIQDERRRNTAKRHMEQAESLEKEGLFQEAIVELEKALRVSDDKTPIYKNLAELYRSQRRLDEAIVSIKKVVKADSGDVRAREMLLEMLLEINRFDDAIQEAKNLLKISPRSLSAREVLSIAYLQKGMFEKALQVTNEMINMDPTSPVNHFKKAVLYQQKGDVGSAIHEFTRVLEMQPDADMAVEAQQAIETLDSHQLRHIVMLAVEDYIFRTKLIHDPESAAVERGYYLSYAGMAALKQIQFDELPDIYSEWKQKYYH